MTLIKSISGIRGTIGGSGADCLNPFNLIKFTYGYARFIQKTRGAHPLIVVGRDARLSGSMVRDIVVGTLQSLGCHVVDIGLATTPTTEMAVIGLKSDGGIIITASHNPKQWNALKLLSHRGEFLSKEEGNEVLRLAESEEMKFVEVDQLGQVRQENYLPKHIQAILDMPEVDVAAIRQAGFSVAFDSINSVGGVALPPLLKALGVETIYPLFDQPSGDFAHNPEPLPKHLVELCKTTAENHAHVGFSVDPDVDRLAIIDENGNPIGEEYTLVAVADYLLDFHQGGNTVSNMSSTRALRDVTERHGGSYTASAVGEVNVVEAMRQTQALIGGEGNGGVIYPALHAGRDALLGIALFLSALARKGVTTSQLRAMYPTYVMSKERVDLPEGANTVLLLEQIAREAEPYNPSTIDGVKIDFENSWVHIRSSNTEPIIRVYTEAATLQEAEALAATYKEKVERLIRG